MPGKVIPDSEVDQLLRRGLTDREVAKYLADHHNIFVTDNAITIWRRRRGDALKRGRHNDLLPWTVKTEHAFKYIPKLLRFEARVRNGETLTPADARRLELFKDKLTAANDGRGAVVHYDPDTEQGWWIVEKRPGIDQGLIRDPKVP